MRFFELHFCTTVIRSSDRKEIAMSKSSGHPVLSSPQSFRRVVRLVTPFIAFCAAANAQPPSTSDAVRFLEHSTFGPIYCPSGSSCGPITSATIAHLQSVGFQTFLTEQFGLSGTPYPTLALQPTTVPTTCTGTCVRDNYTMYPLQVSFFTRAITGQDQLRQRVAFALQQIFVTSGITVTQPSWMTPYLQLFDRNAFGNFRTLLGEITLNPAMGLYLNMAGNKKTLPNENYGREVLQLFTLGLNELNQDGSVVTDGNGNPVPTYTQDIVDAFSRVFTGWNFCASLNTTTCTNFPSAAGTPDYIDPMVVTAANHDFGSKTLFNGLVIPAITVTANQTAAAATKELNQALDNIFNQPSVGPFIARNLIEHLVTSNPSPQYISRVASAFNDNGSGVRGDLKAVVQAILMDQEALNPPTAVAGHLTEPVLFIVRLLRAFNTTSNTTDFVLSDSYLPSGLQMSQDLFRSGSVFNYYPPVFNIPGAAVNGPEFAIQSTSTAFARINFVSEVVFKTMPTSTDRPKGTWLDFSSSSVAPLTALANSPYKLTAALNDFMMHGTMSPTLLGNVNVLLGSMLTATNLAKIQQAVYFIATSPEYFVER
jgi:uncharacterized protein (DUF1800 family)